MPGIVAFLYWLERVCTSYGWYPGEEGFKDKLLGLLDKTAGKLRGKNNHAGGAVRAHHQSEAERILSTLAREFGLPESLEGLKIRAPFSRQPLNIFVMAATNCAEGWADSRLGLVRWSELGKLGGDLP